ncbi:hypothetical protein A3J43_02775 [Candidatus Uhrbacteria bacterium RIFCSPHIGHO2_12_FULL_54_23]|uniref:Uncharacterized protein n=3 Tax=Candidatus Uhriibacteriota TaxID=1752732 RepID=A0A1F7UGX9_9BACT|nr:MAG: hypothetical protein A3J43_02775 [Candidatus Uhrbacteria bacterium RIFCSPHIGHO2_12_FULL_54_23]OGL85116.1 MAG: hypothetical protein A3B36_02030 [Candidatus Uhrbacteria bacterium RIFCSPLOWO2_01_FULL_55_36]OGL91200.1 MAG: hypothetical protein A3J36_01620 [Candidatus Uhrbacteria bacterium RIFCSPLOWO2_02_FULL_54_37]
MTSVFNIDPAVSALIGKGAGVISFVEYFIYIAAILRGTTKPNRATWWVLTLVNVMIVASYWSSGARNTIWVAVSYVVGTLIIAILSIKYGEGKWERLDRVCLFGSVGSFLVWMILRSPFYALAVNVFIDFLALIPTVVKSYLRPWAEDKLAWTLTFVASVLNIFALESWDIAISLYPVYLLLINTIVALCLWRPRGRLSLNQ